MKTRRFCPHCGRPVVKSRTKGYAFQCYGCDEDFYRFEVHTSRQTARHNHGEWAKKEYRISSYGVIFLVEVEAAHFDDFLSQFLKDGFEGGESLFDYIADQQCATAMEGEFDEDCFFYHERGTYRNLAEEYHIKATFRAIDLDGCPWLEVKQLK